MWQPFVISISVNKCQCLNGTIKWMILKRQLFKVSHTIRISVHPVRYSVDLWINLWYGMFTRSLFKLWHELLIVRLTVAESENCFCSHVWWLVSPWDDRTGRLGVKTPRNLSIYPIQFSSFFSVVHWCLKSISFEYCFLVFSPPRICSVNCFAGWCMLILV